ncbi:hypothetical protein DL93DRAFT_2192000 [Clavulina sp. PMI_390]|nr:hypothetical protein DL93DRAFT_2192000 [Clavulina sp. PMI_390]
MMLLFIGLESVMVELGQRHTSVTFKPSSILVALASSGLSDTLKPLTFASSKQFPNLRKITVPANVGDASSAMDPNEGAGEEAEWVVERELGIGSIEAEIPHDIALKVVGVYHENEPCRAWSVLAYERHMRCM